MAEQRSGDLVLPQGTYVLVQDGASGQVEVVTGPHKVSLADTDKPVVYEKESRRYAIAASSDRAIRVCPAADEGQYIVLTNPSKDENGKNHPSKGKQNSIPLEMGRRINIQGPDTFALFPGQVADVIDGHQLKSNEYLLIRVYNESEAKKNLANAVVKTAEGEDTKGNKLFDNKEIRTGNLLIIKGTDVSFYIPPTGIEVLEENGNYTRKAVTLERLEYCILLDQNGDKRYVKGPDVVFPKPTETFITNNGKNVFRATELNENMGIYIKVIADYEEDITETSEETKGLLKKTVEKVTKTGKILHKAGEELFITGKDQKIYFPRAEHAIVKYGSETIYYAVAVPAGEGRYVLDKTTGEVKLVKGPKMLLPDPRNEVIVKRVLDPKTVELWFPGNREALQHNLSLAEDLDESDMDYLESNFTRGMKLARETVYSSAVGDLMGDELKRKTNYTKPRTIQLNTKYDGAVLLNIWPNYAVQIVNKEGERKIVQGPKVVMLEYDETLEKLELSTGKPKSDHSLLKTAYLLTKNNIVSDIITVETKDLVSVDVRLSYKVNFEGDPTKWFNVSDYVKLLTQHMRSLIRNAVKKVDIETFNETAPDFIRNTVLGTVEGKDGETKRPGRSFDENGMNIYDVEILNLEIGDDNIADLLVENQHEIVRQNLELLKLEKDLAYTKKAQDYQRQALEEEALTRDKETEIRLKDEENRKRLEETKLNNKKALEESEIKAEVAKQVDLDSISAAKLKREVAKTDQDTKTQKERAKIQTDAIKAKMESITPGLIEALITNGHVKLADSLAKNLKAQTNGLGTLFGGGGFDEILKTVKGSPLESQIEKIMKAYNDFKSGKPE